MPSTGAIASASPSQSRRNVKGTRRRVGGIATEGSVEPRRACCLWLTAREVAIVALFFALGATGTILASGMRAAPVPASPPSAPQQPSPAHVAVAAVSPCPVASPCSCPSPPAPQAPAALPPPLPTPAATSPPPPLASASASPPAAGAPPRTYVFAPPGSPRVGVQPWEPDPGPLNLADTAIVTMASSDENGMLALTLVQSLRDVGTQVPNIVVVLMRGGTGSAECLDAKWKAARGRTDIRCHSLETDAPEIVSEKILAELERLGAKILVMNPIPRTPYTEGIPGGTQTFWGMALNKLVVFGLTQYRKVVWMDSDDYVVANIDHLLAKPPLTGSLVTACCHGIGPAYPGGGIWVLEPSTAMFDFILDLLSKPRPGTNEIWNLGDMQVIRHIFGASPVEGATEPLYPAINDLRHGYVGGLQYFAAHRGKTQAEFDAYIDSVLDGRKPRVAGFDVTQFTPGQTNWMALDMRYDQCVGSFKCSPERDDPDVMFSVHFSCLQNIQKPSQFASEAAFMEAVSATDDHGRYWFLRWYATFVRATRGRGLPAPKYAGPPVPGFNATHTEIQDIVRLTQSML